MKDDLLAGRTPREPRDGLTVAALVNHFLTHKEALPESGEIAPRTWQRYHLTSGVLVEQFGHNRLGEDLAADDFQALRRWMAKRWGPVPPNAINGFIRPLRGEAR